MINRKAITLAVGVLLVAGAGSVAWGQVTYEDLRDELSREGAAAFAITQLDYDNVRDRAPASGPFTSCGPERCAVCPELRVGAVCQLMPRSAYEVRKRAAQQPIYVPTPPPAYAPPPPIYTNPGIEAGAGMLCGLNGGIYTFGRCDMGRLPAPPPVRCSSRIVGRQVETECR